MRWEIPGGEGDSLCILFQLPGPSDETMESLDEMAVKYFETAGYELNNHEEQMVIDMSLLMEEVLDHSEVDNKVIIDLLLLMLGHIDRTVSEDDYTEDFKKVRSVWSENSGG